MHPNNSSIESFRTQVVGQRPHPYGTLEGPDTHLQIPGLDRVLGAPRGSQKTMKSRVSRLSCVLEEMFIHLGRAGRQCLRKSSVLSPCWEFRADSEF